MHSIYKFVSYTFHPIIIPTIGTLLHFIVTPNINIQYKLTWIGAVFFLTYFSPIIYLLILKKLRIVTDIQLPLAKERLLPLIFSGINFVILIYILSLFSATSTLKYFYTGSLVSLVISYFFALKGKKISLHAIAISGLIGYLLIESYLYKTDLLLEIIVCTILAGLIGNSRLKLKAHTNSELYFGYLIGFNAPIVAFLVYYSM